MHDANPSLTVERLVNDFLYYSQYEKTKPIAGQTVETYIKRLEKVRLAWGDKQIDTITKDDIRAYRAAFLQRGCQPTYANAHMMILRAFFKYCKEERMLNTLDQHEIKLLPRGEPRCRFLRPEEILRFVKAIDTTNIYGIRLMAFVTTLLDTGMRISEAISVNRHRIDWSTKSVFIRGKGGKERVVVFGEWSEFWIKESLKTRTDDCPALFVTYNPQQEAKPIEPEDLRRYFRVICEKTGLGRIHPHMLRKTASTTLYESCNDMRLVQQFLGHSKITTTEWYVGKNVQRLQRVHGEHLHYGKAVEMHMGPRVMSTAWTKSGKYLKCISCNKTDRPHSAKGYCDKCYVRCWRKGIVKPRMKARALTEVTTFATV